MASRCFTDPLDPAADVCDICSGNYCLEHLVNAKGRKNPICIECAMRLSGARSGGPIAPVGDPKTAASRRAELKTGAQKEQPVFLYFDDPDAKLVKEPETYESARPEMPAFGAGKSEASTPIPTPAAPISTAAEPRIDADFDSRDLPVQPPANDHKIDDQSANERLSTVITTKSTILDQIVEDKQNRAEQLAQEMEDRLERAP